MNFREEVTGGRLQTFQSRIHTGFFSAVKGG
jgi:hypothetical protein